MATKGDSSQDVYWQENFVGKGASLVQKVVKVSQYFRSLQKIVGFAGGIVEDDILMFGYFAPNIVEDETNYYCIKQLYSNQSKVFDGPASCPPTCLSAPTIR